MLRINILLGNIFMARNIKTNETNWAVYKKDLISNADFRKFDDMIRKVISGTKQMRIELTEYLEQKRKNGEIIYGIHVSDSALMTCVVDKYEKNHFHFVDGSDGGYAMAAKQMKDQIKTPIINQKSPS